MLIVHFGFRAALDNDELDAGDTCRTFIDSGKIPRKSNYYIYFAPITAFHIHSAWKIPWSRKPAPELSAVIQGFIWPDGFNKLNRLLDRLAYLIGPSKGRVQLS